MTEPRDQPASESEARPESVLSRSLSQPRRAALAVIAGGTPAAERAWAMEWMHGQPAERVAQALADEQVDQLVLHAAQAGGLTEQLPARVIELLSARKMWAAVNVIRQEHVLGEACALLKEIGVGYVVFKGALAMKERLSLG